MLINKKSKKPWLVPVPIFTEHMFNRPNAKAFFVVSQITHFSYVLE